MGCGVAVTVLCGVHVLCRIIIVVGCSLVMAIVVGYSLTKAIVVVVVMVILHQMYGFRIEISRRCANIVVVGIDLLKALFENFGLALVQVEDTFPEQTIRPCEPVVLFEVSILSFPPSFSFFRRSLRTMNDSIRKHCDF